MSTWWVPPTLRGYQPAWLSADLLAGLTLVAVALPSQMATAHLAGVSAVLGLYAFIAGSFVFALIGKSRHLSVGADSTIAPVLVTGVASIAVVGSAGYVTAMAFTAVLVGAVLIIVGVFRMGWIAEFLSTPVITGVLAGIAVQIVLRQLPAILGVAGGGTTAISRVRDLVDQAGHVNGWTLGIAVGVLVIIVVGQLIDHRVPGALVALVGSIVAVELFGLASHHGVIVLGTVHGGLPHVGLHAPSWSQLRQLPATVLIVSFICIAQTAATVRASPGPAPAASDFNRDLIGIGAGSVAAGLVGAFAVDSSPPNTALVNASGGRTQLANILAAAVVFVVVLFATGPLAHLPEATLGATLIFIATKLFRVSELRRILRFDRFEFGLAAVTVLAVVFLGIEGGIGLAILLSLADRTRRTARPRDAVLGREPGTDHWIPVDVGRPTEQVEGVLVYLVYTPLWYGNADYVHLRVTELVALAEAGSGSPVHAVILDANGMSDIDYTGLQALRDLASELSAEGTTIGIARGSHLVHHDLKHGALLERLGSDHLFTSVDAAVKALGPGGEGPG